MSRIAAASDCISPTKSEEQGDNAEAGAGPQRIPCIGSATGRGSEPIELPSTDPPSRRTAEAATTRGGQGSRSGAEPTAAADTGDEETPASRHKRAPNPHGTPSQLPPPSCIPCSGRLTQVNFQNAAFFHIVARWRACARALSAAHGQKPPPVLPGRSAAEEAPAEEAAEVSVRWAVLRLTLLQMVLLLLR